MNQIFTLVRLSLCQSVLNPHLSAKWSQIFIKLRTEASKVQIDAFVILWLPSPPTSLAARFGKSVYLSHRKPNLQKTYNWRAIPYQITEENMSHENIIFSLLTQNTNQVTGPKPFLTPMCVFFGHSWSNSIFVHILEVRRKTSLKTVYWTFLKRYSYIRHINLCVERYWGQKLVK